jgi:hypothetical protein
MSTRRRPVLLFQRRREANSMNSNQQQSGGSAPNLAPAASMPSVPAVSVAVQAHSPEAESQLHLVEAAANGAAGTQATAADRQASVPPTDSSSLPAHLAMDGTPLPSSTQPPVASAATAAANGAAAAGVDLAAVAEERKGRGLIRARNESETDTFFIVNQLETGVAKLEIFETKVDWSRHPDAAVVFVRLRDLLSTAQHSLRERNAELEQARADLIQATEGRALHALLQTQVQEKEAQIALLQQQASEFKHALQQAKLGAAPLIEDDAMGVCAASSARAASKTYGESDDETASASRSEAAALKVQIAALKAQQVETKREHDAVQHECEQYKLERDVKDEKLVNLQVEIGKGNMMAKEQEQMIAQHQMHLLHVTGAALPSDAWNGMKKILLDGYMNNSKAARTARRVKMHTVNKEILTKRDSLEATANELSLLRNELPILQAQLKLDAQNVDEKMDAKLDRVDVKEKERAEAEDRRKAKLKTEEDTIEKKRSTFASLHAANPVVDIQSMLTSMQHELSHSSFHHSLQLLSPAASATPPRVRPAAAAAAAAASSSSSSNPSPQAHSH